MTMTTTPTTPTKLVRLAVPLADWLKQEAAKARRTQPTELAVIIEAEKARREGNVTVSCSCSGGEPCQEAPTTPAV